MSIKITPQAPQGTTPDANRPRSDVPARLRITAILLYAIFIGILLAVTMRVSSPQSESMVHLRDAGLIRLALGFGVCLWILFHLFMLPKDAEGYRTWIYLGVIVIPFALALAFAVW